MDNPNKFLNKLFEMQITTHVMHLQTTNYNDHKVLGDFYEAMGGFADYFAEQYQGATGETLVNIGPVIVREGAQAMSYLKECRENLIIIHSECEILTVKLVIENILTCLNSTLYLLKLN